MEHTFYTDTKTRLDLKTIEDDGFIIEVFVGGKWGRFVYDRIFTMFASLWVALTLTIVAFEYLMYNYPKYGLDTDNRAIFIWISITVIVLFFKYVFSSLIEITGNPIFSIWQNFVKEKPTKLYNFSTKDVEYEDRAFLYVQLPPELILGITKGEESFTIYNLLMKSFHIAVNGKFSEEDIDKIVGIISTHLNLQKDTTAKRKHDLDSISNKNFNLDQNQRKSKYNEYKDKIIDQRSSEELSSTRSPILTILWAVIILSLALISGSNMDDAFERTDLLLNLVYFFLFAFFGSVFTFTFLSSEFYEKSYVYYV